MSEKKGKKEKKEEYAWDEAKLQKMLVVAKPAGLRPSIPQPKRKKDKQKEEV